MLCHAQFHIYTSISIVCIYNIHRTVSFSYVCVVPPVFSFIFISLFSFGFSYDTRKVFALDNNTAKGGSEQKFKPKEEHKVFSRLATPNNLLNKFCLDFVKQFNLDVWLKTFRTSFRGTHFFSHTFIYFRCVLHTTKIQSQQLDVLKIKCC